MADQNHIKLANFIKGVHSELRLSTIKLGAEKAWDKHCGNRDVLNTYSQYMQALATTHWEANTLNDKIEATSRIKWARDFCYDYFIDRTYVKYTSRDEDVASKINVDLDKKETFQYPLNLLDVGSCYNPFKIYKEFNVTAIDLCPANETVFQCDILKVAIGSNTTVDGKNILELKENSFEIVTFCFVLEYIPSSALRIQACQNVYKLLKYGGLLIITTPDSKHVGANCKLMKSWQYTLAIMGFTRIKYEKQRHMHCMAFRKSLHKQVAERWASIHRTPQMEFAIHIPQDFTTSEQISENNSKVNVSVSDFTELPFAEA